MDQIFEISQKVFLHIFRPRPQNFFTKFSKFSKKYFYIFGHAHKIFDQIFEISQKVFLHIFSHAHKKIFDQIFEIFQKVFLHIFGHAPKFLQ